MYAAAMGAAWWIFTGVLDYPPSGSETTSGGHVIFQRS